MLGPNWVEIIIYNLRLTHLPLNSVLVITFFYFKSANGVWEGEKIKICESLSCNEKFNLYAIVKGLKG